MVTKRVLVAIKGETKKGKKWEVGGMERHCSEQMIFDHHIGVTVGNLLIAMQLW
jgi:hypothetical protein